MTSDLPGNDPIDVLRAALGSQFEIERRLGQGGMGAVYLARDLTLERHVAIKVISPDVADSTTLRERFLLEARSVARLRHPNIVSVYTAGESNGTAYFVMEYVPGESLRDLMEREGSVTGERGERIVREIALALDYAHAQGLVHRDVKPENILLDAESGRAMLTDFGIARAFEKDAAMTQAGMILGSPRYMAPEQASGDRAIDGRSDLYTLALVAYELLTGAPVVRDGSIASMLVKHVTETPPPLTEKVKGISPVVSDAVSRGLEKDPDKRWQTGRQFAEALAGAPLTNSGEIRGLPTRPSLSRKFKLAGVAALIAVVAVGAWAVSRMGGSVGNAYLVTPFEVQSGDSRVQWLKDGSVNMLTLTLGQWSDLNVINYEKTLSLLDAAKLGTKARLSLDDAIALAKQANAGTVLTGQIQLIGDSLIVTAKLFDVGSGKALQQAQQGALVGADPRPLYDRLAQDLLKIAGGPSAGVQLSQVTTTSIEAYRAYLNGVRHLNSWRLADADSEFATAIRLDSTFALAHHKRSLGLGWSEAGAQRYVQSAEMAASLSKRLPPREAALVQGHYHLSRGMYASMTGKGDRAEFDSTIAVYRALLAKDSLVAEAWYGLADGYFHGSTFVQNADTSLLYLTNSLRGFHRTLAVDSTFHLAYSHLVSLYNNATNGNGPAVVGDTAFIAMARAGSSLPGLRAAAQARGVQIARAWARAEPTSSQPVLQLSQSFYITGRQDSALAVLRAAVGTRTASDVAFRLSLLVNEVAAQDTGAASTLAYVLDHYTADSLRTLSTGPRYNLSGIMLTAAGARGRMSDVERASRLLEEANPNTPFVPMPTAPIMRMYRHAMRIALGEPVTPDLKRELAAMVRVLDTISNPIGNQTRQNSVAVPLLVFLATYDTTFAHYAKKWANGLAPEIDAMIALRSGDTATAERIAKTFATPDSLRKPGVRFGTGGLRSIARAEVLAQAGLKRQAAETYEAIDPARVSFNSVVEPGFAVQVRTLLTRARLWRELGEREKAIASYEAFIRQWKDADGAAAKEVAVAKQELATFRDSRR